MGIVQIHILLMIFGYLAIIGVLCFLSNHLTHNISDFVLGGRRLSAPIAAMGACASDMSSWLVMALPAVAWLWGWQAIWVPVGLIIGAYCNWSLVAARLRVYTELLDDALTIPDYLVRRFEDERGLLRAISALVVIIFFIGYAASGFVAASLLIHQIFNITYFHALILLTILFTTYTVLGGFLAISWVDFFQGILVFIGVLLLVICLHQYYPHHQQWGHVFYRMHASEAILMTSHPLGMHAQSVVNWISKIAWGLGYFGQVHILVRFMAIKNVSKISQAKWIAVIWMAVAMFAVMFLGMLGYYIFMPHHANFNHQLVIMMLVKHFFSTYWYGLAVALVMSVIMSALAAQLLVSSSAVSEDVYRVYVRPNASKLELLFISRMAVILIAIIAACFAYNPHTSLFHMVGYAWSGLGASFGPVILMSLYKQTMSKQAAIVGMLTGALTVIVWALANHFYGGIFSLYELVPGFIISVLSIIIVSRFTIKVPQSMLVTYRKYNNLIKTI